jgi:hypothetical protein
MAAGDPGTLKRNYSAIAVETTLSVAISSQASGDTNTGFVVASVSGFPSTFPYTLLVDPDTNKEEVLTVYAGAGTSLSVYRGQDGSAAPAHSAGATVRHGISAREFKELQTHISARGFVSDSGILNNVDIHVHGIITGEGDVVGTLKEQTLTNKTISGSANTVTNIGTTSLVDSAVTTAKITDLNVTTGKIADSAITSAKIADLGIATGDIADSAITSGKIATGAVGTTKIDDLSVTTAKINDAAITAGKIASDAVTTVKILDANVTTAKIADSAVTSAKIADGTIVAGDIADGAITSAKILDGTIATADLADSAVTSAKIADATIVNADISGTAGIAYTKLSLGGTITSADIVDGTIVASDIANGTITAAKMVTDPYARANHTGTQTASTISDFDTQVRTSRLDQMAAPTAAVSVNSQKVTSLGTPTDNADAATKLYVDTKVADLVNSAPSTLDTLGEIATAIEAGGTVYESFVLKTGSTMTGALTLSGAPTVDLHAATKAYVDTVAGSATAAADSAAAAATTYDNFDDRYLGAKASAPSVDNDGDALVTGAIYWNSSSNQMYAWTGSAWGSISSTADIYRFRFTAAGGETTISGTDDNGLTLSYIVGKEQVYLNGVLLARTSDYTASNGSSITSLSALAASDIVEIITFTAFELADSIARSVLDAKGDLIVATSADTPGKLAVGTNGYFLKANSSTATGLEWAQVDLSSYITSSTAASTYSTISSNNDQDIMQIMQAY